MASERLVTAVRERKGGMAKREKDEMEELEKDIAVLLKEPSQKRFVNNSFSN